MRRHNSFILLSALVVGCGTTHPRSGEEARARRLGEVIVMPLDSARGPTLAPTEVESLHRRMSKQRLQERAVLEAALPRGLRLMPVSYSLMSLVDASGSTHPYTETISVCRLSKDWDLVVVEDNRSGKDIVRDWVIRDLSSRGLTQEHQ